MNRTTTLMLLLVGAAAHVSCGGGGGGDGSPTEPGRSPQTVLVQVTDNSYVPKSVTIQPGDTVRWEMRGADPTHTVTAIDGAFDSGTVFTQPGRTFEVRFETTGVTHNYSCRAHSDCCEMKGSIRVGDGAPRGNPGYE